MVKFPSRALFPAICFSLFALGLSPPCIQAQPNDAPEAPASSSLKKEPLQLAPIKVHGGIESSATGRSHISGEVIPKLPLANGSINEALRVLPDVTVEDKARTSLTAGEILPPPVSISGGRTFQNFFLIDGFGNNSLLDPTADSPLDPNRIPGHSQELFLDADLVGSLTVYDSNVPARYGEFTGGVVKATTRLPASEFGGKIALRHTRDDWTEFHLSESDTRQFADSTSAKRQPEFEKTDARVQMDIPLGPNGGLLAAWSLVDSTIPLRHLGKDEEEERRLQNYLLKFQGFLGDAASVELLAAYTPYEERRLREDTLHSAFTIEGGGLLLGATYLHAFSAADLEMNLAYRNSENSREAPQHLRFWKNTDSKPWGSFVGSSISKEGGLGDVDTTQESLEFRTHVQGQPFGDRIRQAWAGGIDIERVRGTYERREASHFYNEAEFNDVVICSEDTFACVDGEQFFTGRQVYGAFDAAAVIHTLALYTEDSIDYGRFNLRPGLRLSWDDFMENLNAAPRLAATWDLFGSGRTVLTAGLNRYYGRTLLTYKLRETIPPVKKESRELGAEGLDRNRPIPWKPAIFSARNAHRFSQLDTPYSDEVALGLDQALFGGRLNLKFVHREGKDEFAKEYGSLQPDGLRYYTLNNAGRSQHTSYRATWDRQWEKHFVSVNGVYREDKDSNEDFDSLIEEESFEERVWYRDRIVYRGNLPDDRRDDFWELKLTYIAELPWGLSFTNFTRYRSSFEQLENTRDEQFVERIDETDSTPEEIVDRIYVYDWVEYEDFWVFDWRIAWEKAIYRENSLTLSLEINNVFDEKIDLDPVNETYALGRQFWAGLEYRF